VGDREVSFDINATDKSGPAVTAAARGLDNLGDQAAGAVRQMTRLERETAQLRTKMLETAAAAKVLGHEFARTGDNKVLKDFEKMTREADKLGRVLKKIEPPQLTIKARANDADSNTLFRKLFGGLVDQAQQAGKLAGGAAINSFGDAFRAIPPEIKGGVVAALAGAAVLAAPFIASALSGAILAGVAGGGVAAGLILAAQDPKIQAAYAALGNDIMDTLTDSAKPFRDELATAAPNLAAEFQRQAPRIKAIFANLAPAAGALIRGVSGAIDELAPGLQRASAVGGKILTSLGGQLPALGAAVGHLLDALSQGGAAASQALKALVADTIVLIHTLAIGAQAAAPLLNALAKFDQLVNPLTKTGDQVTVLTSHVQASGAAASTTATYYNNMAASMGNTRDKADALNESFNRLFGEAMSLDQANLAVKQGYLALSESVKENGRTLSDNTEKGLANQGAILTQIQALDAKRQAEIAAGNGTAEATQKANAAYASNVAALRQVLLNLGFAASEVDRLIGKYQALASTPDIVIKVTTQYSSTGQVTRPGAGNSQGAGLSALRDWQPYRFAAGHAEPRVEGTFRTGGPTEVRNTIENRLYLDGRLIHAYTEQAIAQAEARNAYRTKVGTR
jgi:hypothetical protein